ncbi:hypothetical protein [Streptomonospora sediminis]
MEAETSDFAIDSVKAMLRRLPLEEDGPQWFGRVGDLVVVGDDKVMWKDPKYWADGGCRYPAPPGTHPVYAAAYDSGKHGTPHFRVFQLVLPFASWEQVAEAQWSRFDDPEGAQVENCAFLSTDRSEDAAVRRWWERESDTMPWLEEAVGSAGVLAEPGNYPSAIADPGSGANILGFPVVELGFVDAYTARNAGGDLVALILWIDEP